MSFVSITSYSGQPIVSTLDGSVRLETGSSKIAVQSTDNNQIGEINSNGVTTYDSTGKVMLRSGVDPTGSDGITVIAIEGQDALENI